jgi:2-polyprenyl-3-methyl-5-hydroxy-6-metoxy-1,4-benzoquinol methylase
MQAHQDNKTYEAPPFERYKFKGSFGSSHNWALSKIAKYDRNLRVLDFGSGSGAIGSELTKLGFKEIYSVEIDDLTRDHTKELYLRSEKTLEAFQDTKFDIVLLLDVLEHLENPQEFLKDLTKFLNPNAILLISVPNITHWSIRISSLFGKFEYTSRGILDKTHLHFFTKKHLHKVILDTKNFFLVSTGASISPAEFVLPEKISNTKCFEYFSKFRHAVAQVIPTIAAYQLLAEVSYKLEE